MGESAEKIRLEMKAKYSNKEAYDKKIGIVRRRVEAKEAYVSALQDLLSNLSKAIIENDGLNRSRYAVEYFETLEKIGAQKAILSQHKTYLEEMQKIAPNE
jgi:putative N-acetylmannosamine-6-phosphate epimerase